MNIYVWVVPYQHNTEPRSHFELPDVPVGFTNFTSKSKSFEQLGWFLNSLKVGGGSEAANKSDNAKIAKIDAATLQLICENNPRKTLVNYALTEYILTIEISTEQ